MVCLYSSSAALAASVNCHARKALNSVTHDRDFAEQKTGYYPRSPLQTLLSCGDIRLPCSYLTWRAWLAAMILYKRLAIAPSPSRRLLFLNPSSVWPTHDLVPSRRWLGEDKAQGLPKYVACYWIRHIGQRGRKGTRQENETDRRLE
jgi:hypothetical protein